MKKLITGVAGGVIVFIIFLTSQNSFAEAGSKRNELKKDTLISKDILKLNNEVIRSLGQKVDDMEKYVNETQKYIDSSQKNLDLWLKYLAFTLSILIGYSIFNGLRSKERATDELNEIKAIKEEIKSTVKDAEGRLKMLTDKITEIENASKSAKTIEERMVQQLKEFSEKEEIALDGAQNKKLDNLIAKTKEELHNSGLDILKNLYNAKSIKAKNEKNWDDVIRLTSSFIDLDDSNGKIYTRRGYAYYKLFQDSNRVEFEEKAFNDYSKSILLDNNSQSSYNNRGLIYFGREEYDKALADYNEAIRINPEYARGYSNRAIVYEAITKIEEAKNDREKANQLDPENYKI